MTISNIFEENLKESLNTRKKKIFGSRRKMTMDEEKLLDEALDDKCQGGKFLK